MGHSTTRSKAAAATAAAAKSSSNAGLLDITNTAAAARVPSKGAKASKAKKYTQADVDALTAQFEADVAAAEARIHADHVAETADLERRLANAQRIADEAAATAAMDTSEDNTIPKPVGSAGDGFKLLAEMRLVNNKLEYDRIRRKVHGMCARVKLDMAKPFRKQEARKIVHLCDKMREDFPYLRRFVGDWPTKELARLYLKHVRAYEKRKQAAINAALAALPHRDDDDAGSGAEA